MVDAIKGKYRIVREIARSNDIVYEAIDSTLGRRIALKELNIAPGMTGQPRRERIERFNREARAAGKLNHPNIVSVTDCFEENGRYFIVMEYLEGQTLRDIMQVRGVLPLQEAIGIACQVLDALGNAHQYKVIHRDIKPDNIFLLPGGQVKLADFGIARLSEEPALTSNGQVFGTPSYMSPEQIEGRGIDHRSDLFSLGVLLYEMLTGRKPFVGDSVISITYAVMNAEPPPMNGVPMGVEQVIRRALSKNPAGRQTSAEQMKMDLRNAEQTPAAFFTPHMTQSGMSRTGMGSNGSYLPGSPQGGYVPNYPPANTGYGSSGYAIPPAQIPPTSYSTPDPSAASGLPWSWNAQGPTGSAPLIYPSMMPSSAPPAPSMSGYPPPNNASGVYPFASPPYPVRPSEPLFVLSPGGRTFLISLLVAAIIGGSIALGVIAVKNSYANYKQAADTQQVANLINDGAAAYNSGDYAKAMTIFEQGLQLDANSAQKEIIRRNLAYTYVQSARTANGRGDWQTARDLYTKAVSVWSDYEAAHKELADLLSQHGDLRGAENQRVAVSNDPGKDPTPLKMDNRLPPSAVIPTPDNTPQVDPNQFPREREAEADRLIAEGDELRNRGDPDGARKKWQDAIEKAPGTQQAAAARQRLDISSPPPMDNGE